MLTASFVRAARQIAQLADSAESDLVVIVELVGGLRHSGVDHAVHVVEPPVETSVGIVPIRRPSEISRIDVSGQTLLETVQLVWTDEMHLAR